MRSRIIFVTLLILSAVTVLILLRPRHAAWSADSYIPSTEPLPPSSQQDQAPSITKEALRRLKDPIRRPEATDNYRKLAEGEILFYGRLEDQYAKPVPAATVDFTVDASLGFKANYENGSVRTDADGLFTISGYKGSHLSIQPKASGYVLASTNAWANYSFFSDRGEHHNPDRKNPVVIRMWKLKGAEELIRVSGRFRFPMPSNSIHIDLLLGKIVPDGGDIELFIRRPPGSISVRSKAQWGLILKPVNGGIQQVDGVRSRLTFEAPTNGYEQTIQIDQNPDDTFWASSVSFGAFLKSRDEQVFSKLSVSFGLNEDPGGLCWLEVQSLSNPNGSRNWEEDPRKIKLVKK